MRLRDGQRGTFSRKRFRDRQDLGDSSALQINIDASTFRDILRESQHTMDQTVCVLQRACSDQNLHYKRLGVDTDHGLREIRHLHARRPSACKRLFEQMYHLAQKPPGQCPANMDKCNEPTGKRMRESFPSYAESTQ